MIKYDVDFIILLKFDKRPFRARFSPNRVFAALDEYRCNFVSLKKYLKKFKIEIKTEECLELAVSGEFCSEDGIILHIFGDYECKIADDEWHMFKFRLVQTIMHELQHWRQFERRGHNVCKVFKYISKHEEAAYYSSKDEIEAYSHCIILELYRELKYFDVTNIMDFSEYSETYEYIFHTVFNYDCNNIALVQYKKTITKWSKLYIALSLPIKREKDTTRLKNGY